MLARFVVCGFLRDRRWVHLAVNQPAYWRRWGVWIKFHPYALELFSRVSPAGAPVAFCCQRNYGTRFHSRSGPRERINPPRLFRISALKLFLFTSLEWKQNRTCRSFSSSSKPTCSHIYQTILVYILWALLGAHVKKQCILKMFRVTLKVDTFFSKCFVESVGVLLSVLAWNHVKFNFQRSRS